MEGDGEETEVVETPEVEGEEPEAEEPEVEKPNGEGKPDEEPKLSAVDQLLTSRPDWLKAQIEALGDEDLDPKDLEELERSVGGQRVVAHLMKRADAGVPELSKQQQELRTKELELAARERMLSRKGSDNLKVFTDQRWKTFLDTVGKEVETEPEQGTAEWVEWLSKKAGLGLFQRWMGQAQEVQKGFDEEHKAAETKAAADAQKAEDLAYLEAHLDTIVEDSPLEKRMAVLMQKHGHRLQEAHEIALREAATSDAKKVVEDARKEARTRVVRGGRVGPVLPPTPSEPAERLAFYEKYPEAIARDYEAMFGSPPPAE